MFSLLLHVQILLPLKLISCNSYWSHHTLCSTNYTTYVTVIIVWFRYSTPWPMQLFLVVALLGDPILAKIPCYMQHSFVFFFWVMWQSSGIYLPPLYHDIPSQSKNTIRFLKLQTLTTPDSIKLDYLKASHTNAEKMEGQPPTFTNFSNLCRRLLSRHRHTYVCLWIKYRPICIISFSI